jgi:hypothetical protein
MKYAVEMGSGVMMCTPSLINIGQGIQNFMGRYTQTRKTAWKSHKPTCIFFKIREVSRNRGVYKQRNYQGMYHFRSQKPSAAAQLTCSIAFRHLSRWTL